jgi:hypothetical protein
VSTTIEGLARAAFSGLDPLPPEHPLPAAELHRVAALRERITLEPAVPPPARPRRGPLPVAAAAVAVMLVAVAVWGDVGGSGRPAIAATPPLLQPLGPPTGPARPVLEQAAVAALNLSPPGDGTHAHVRIASWYLSTEVSGGQARSEIIPAVTERWTGPDGATTVARSEGDGATAEVERYAPGEYGTVVAADLPAEPAALRDALLGNEQVPDGPELLDDAEGILRAGPLTPAQLSTLWGALALQPDLQVFGPVTDRAGRQGVAVGLDTDYGGLPSRLLLLLDPATGRPLGNEEILTTDPGLLNVAIPSVIGYEAYLETGWVDASAVP